MFIRRMVLAAICLFSKLGFSQQAPEWMEGATVVIKLQSGKEYIYSVKQLKMIPKSIHNPPGFKATPPKLTECPKVEPEIRTEIVEKPTYIKSTHHITAHVGFGLVGLQDQVQRVGTKQIVTVRKAYGAVAGLSYKYLLLPDKDLSISVTGLTNQTGLVGVGLEF